MKLKDKLKADTMFLLNNHFEYSGSDYDVVSTYLDCVIEMTISYCADVLEHEISNCMPSGQIDSIGYDYGVAKQEGVEQAQQRLLDLIN